MVVGLTWAPLLVLCLMQGSALGGQIKIPFLFDFSMYGRFVIGLPLLVFAEIVIDPAIRGAVGEFVRAGIVPPSEWPATWSAGSSCTQCHRGSSRRERGV